MTFDDFDTQIQVEEMTFSGMNADERAEYEEWLDDMEAATIESLEMEEGFTDKDYDSPWYRPFSALEEENNF